MPEASLNYMYRKKSTSFVSANISYASQEDLSSSIFKINTKFIVWHMLCSFSQPLILAMFANGSILYTLRFRLSTPCIKFPGMWSLSSN